MLEPCVCSETLAGRPSDELCLQRTESERQRYCRTSAARRERDEHTLTRARELCLEQTRSDRAFRKLLFRRLPLSSKLRLVLCCSCALVFPSNLDLAAARGPGDHDRFDRRLSVYFVEGLRLSYQLAEQGVDADFDDDDDDGGDDDDDDDDAIGRSDTVCRKRLQHKQKAGHGRVWPAPSDGVASATMQPPSPPLVETRSSATVAVDDVAADDVAAGDVAADDVAADDASASEASSTQSSAETATVEAAAAASSFSERDEACDAGGCDDPRARPFAEVLPEPGRKAYRQRVVAAYEAQYEEERAALLALKRIAVLRVSPVLRVRVFENRDALDRFEWHDREAIYRNKRLVRLLKERHTKHTRDWVHDDELEIMAQDGFKDLDDWMDFATTQAAETTFRNNKEAKQRGKFEEKQAGMMRATAITHSEEPTRTHGLTRP